MIGVEYKGGVAVIFPKARGKVHTGKAVCVEIEGDNDATGKQRERWVPQSVIHIDSEVFARGHSGKLVVETWWAKTNGLYEER